MCTDRWAIQNLPKHKLDSVLLIIEIAGRAKKNPKPFLKNFFLFDKNPTAAAPLSCEEFQNRELGKFSPTFRQQTIRAYADTKKVP